MRRLNPNLARTLAHRQVIEKSDVYAAAVQEKDRNTCVVDALAILTGCKWIEAYRALKDIRMGFRMGMPRDRISDYLEVFSLFGCTVALTIGFLSDTESYLILQENHACAYVRGQAMNKMTSARVLSAWRVDKV